jgi:hypothetical protein
MNHPFLEIAEIFGQLIQGWKFLCPLDLCTVDNPRQILTDNSLWKRRLKLPTLSVMVGHIVQDRSPSKSVTFLR